MFIGGALLSNATPALPVSYDIATARVGVVANDAYWLFSKKNLDDYKWLIETPSASQEFAKRMGGVRGEIDASYKVAVETAFNRFGCGRHLTCRMEGQA